MPDCRARGEAARVDGEFGRLPPPAPAFLVVLTGSRSLVKLGAFDGEAFVFAGKSARATSAVGLWVVAFEAAAGDVAAWTEAGLFMVKRG